MSNSKPELPPSEPLAAVEEAIQEVVDIKEGDDDKEKYKSESGEKVTLKHFFRIFTYGTKLDSFYLFLAILASIGAGVTMPLMNIIFGRLVGTFSKFFTPGSGVTADEFSDSINNLTLYLVYIWIGKFVLCYISKFTLRIVGIRISAAIRLAYLKALFAQSISVLDTLPSGSAAGIITAQANLLQIGISEKLGVFFQSIALLIAAYVIAFVYSWKLTLVTSSILLFVLVVYGAILPFMIKYQKSKDHSDQKAIGIASEVLTSIRMVAACGAEPQVAKRFGGWIEESRRRGLKLSPVLGAQFAPFFFSLFADFALTFWFGIHLYVERDIDSVSTVLIVLMSVLLSVSSLSQVIAPVISFTKAAGAASSFFTMIDRPPMECAGLGEREVDSANDIVFENVVFAYPSRPHVKVLDNFNVTFEAGKLTAIVGPSGSGKSTIVGLLERWYELNVNANNPPPGSRPPSKAAHSRQHSRHISSVGSTNTTIAPLFPVNEKDGDHSDSSDLDGAPVALSGEINIGGFPISILDMKWWRSQIGLVQQEPFVFNDTIENNVAHGLIGSRFENESEEVKKQLVREACEEAFADEFIQRLPLGYNTIVGESGIKLSGGQRQRIAIARSIIKKPQILIFDEATSAIDVRGERKVQTALDRVSKHRTTITIAHRLSTVKKADKIVVVKKGVVVEQGTHEELLDVRDGVYYGLVHAQKLTLEDTIEDEGGDEYKAPLTRSESKVYGHDKEDVELASTNESQAEEEVYVEKGWVNSFGLLLREQKKHHIWLYLTFLGALGGAVAQPLQAYLMAQIITVFQQITPESLLAGASYWALRFVYLAIGVGVAYFIIGWASNSFSMHVSCSYRQEYFESITRQPISFFDHEDHSTGTLVSRITGDPQGLQEMLGVPMAMALIAMLSVIGCVAIAFSYGWKLSLVAIVSALPIILAASFYRLRFEIQFEKMNAAVFADSSKFAAEAISAFRTVTSLTLEDMICDRYARLLQGHVDEASKKARFTTLVLALSDSVGLLCMALTFWYGGRLMATREIDAVHFLIIYTAIIQGSEQAGQWMSFGPNMAQATASANRILSFRRQKTSADHHVPMPTTPKGTRGAALTFKNIHFKYPTRETPIFRGLNLSIKAGQFAALVGPSGCGKTSVISLLEQFYQVESGAIFFDGIDIKTLNMKQYREAFSLVAQEASLFQGTIKENILLGAPEGTISDNELHEACKQAEIHTFISSLPNGYSTDIGSRGVALSGGQKQRLSIARALIRNPRVLLLDEATSSLDSESEMLVQAAFERAGKGRTMVVVAHRLATVQNADVIFVFGDGGKIVEQGSHAELVNRRGAYWQMCQSQALDR